MTALLDARQRAMLAEMGIRWHEPLARSERCGKSPSGSVVRNEASRAAAASAAPGRRGPRRRPYRRATRAMASRSARHRNSCSGTRCGRRWPNAGPASCVPGGATRCSASATASGLADRGRGARRERGPAGRAIRRAPPASCWTTCSRPWAWTASTRSTLPTSSNAAHRPTATRCPQEVAQCEPFLRRQIQLLQPRIILAMGRFAVQTLLGNNEPIGKLRGRIHSYREMPVVVTYHPAYLLRNPRRQGPGLGRPVPGPGLDRSSAGAETRRSRGAKARGARVRAA